MFEEMITFASVLNIKYDLNINYEQCLNSVRPAERLGSVLRN